MTTINIPISEALSDAQLIEKVQSGLSICLTQAGKPKAMIVPVNDNSRPWRVSVPDDPTLYGDLQSPVLDPWK